MDILIAYIIIGTLIGLVFGPIIGILGALILAALVEV